ncbi:MAG: hypothetical protein GDA67_02905 [Nitrospira sp. CR1.3]|nr:hypothetical protein [Nitrospira sp. CR1.3]
MSWVRSSVVLYVVLAVAGCTHQKHSPSGVTEPQLKIVVGPVALDAAITKSTQIHTFDESPPPETESTIQAVLLDEIQTQAQQILTQELARQERFEVVPFKEVRRAQADIAPQAETWTHDHLMALGRNTNAELVMDAHILDYGVVRWQYWVTGWLTHATIATTIVGLATAWNPAAIGAYLAFDVSTDLPIWWGGAQVFGWAFRPVRVQIDVLQLAPCEGLVWRKQELLVKVPGKELAGYSPEEQTRKEVQLGVNLHQALSSLVESAAETLSHQPCDEEGRPQKVAGFSMWRWLDLLH